MKWHTGYIYNACEKHDWFALVAIVFIPLLFQFLTMHENFQQSLLCVGKLHDNAISND